jgi:hypothetical protein
MFFVKHLECVYGDTKNPLRNTSRDRVREIECYSFHSLDEAKDAIFSILDRYGGIRKLTPKIISNSRGVMWIECESAFQMYEANGVVDLKCLAFEIQFREPESTQDMDTGMKSFASALGPSFYL